MGQPRFYIKAYLSDMKVKRGCEDCGENHPAVLDFHHRDEDTKFKGISKMVAQGYPLERILEEVAKCTVLCANCHRRFHWEADQYNR
jgi:hypothetical protein